MATNMSEALDVVGPENLRLACQQIAETIRGQLEEGTSTPERFASPWVSASPGTDVAGVIARREFRDPERPVGFGEIRLGACASEGGTWSEEDSEPTPESREII